MSDRLPGWVPPSASDLDLVATAIAALDDVAGAPALEPLADSLVRDDLDDAGVEVLPVVASAMAAALPGHPAVARAQGMARAARYRRELAARSAAVATERLAAHGVGAMVVGDLAVAAALPEPVSARMHPRAALLLEPGADHRRMRPVLVAAGLARAWGDRVSDTYDDGRGGVLCVASAPAAPLAAPAWRAHWWLTGSRQVLGGAEVVTAAPAPSAFEVVVRASDGRRGLDARWLLDLALLGRHHAGTWDDVVALAVGARWCDATATVLSTLDRAGLVADVPAVPSVDGALDRRAQRARASAPGTLARMTGSILLPLRSLGRHHDVTPAQAPGG